MAVRPRPSAVVVVRARLRLPLAEPTPQTPRSGASAQ